MKIQSDSIQLDREIELGIRSLGIRNMFKGNEVEDDELLPASTTIDELQVKLPSRTVVKSLGINIATYYKLKEILGVQYFTNNTLTKLFNEPPINLTCCDVPIPVNLEYVKKNTKGFIDIETLKNNDRFIKLRSWNKVKIYKMYGRKFVSKLDFKE